MFMVVYALTIISYYYYAEDYNAEDYTKFACYSLVTWFVYSFDQTFKNDGGLSGVLEAPYAAVDDGTADFRYGRIIYDNIAFLLVGMLLIEIVTGLITDTFGTLRENNQKILDDENTNWFICDKTRDELEKEFGVDGFENHFKHDHNLWDYLFYIAYLNCKGMKWDNTLTTGERYVVDKLDKGDNTWLPCYA